MTLLNAEGKPLPPKMERLFTLTPIVDLEHGVGFVDLTPTQLIDSYRLTPSEAQTLGMQLIIASNTCLHQTIAMEMMIKLGEMSKDEAMQVLTFLFQTTMEKHRAYELARKQPATEDAPSDPSVM